MKTGSITDPVFGELVNEYGDWVAAVEEPRFVGWGQALDEIFKDEGSVQGDLVAELEGRGTILEMADDFALELVHGPELHGTAGWAERYPVG